MRKNKSTYFRKSPAVYGFIWLYDEKRVQAHGYRIVKRFSKTLSEGTKFLHQHYCMHLCTFLTISFVRYHKCCEEPHALRTFFGPECCPCTLTLTSGHCSTRRCRLACTDWTRSYNGGLLRGSVHRLANITAPPASDLGVLHILNSYTQSVELLGRGIRPSQGRFLYTGQHKHRMSAKRYPCLQWDSNRVRTSDRAVTVIGSF
jgi:hypothetical protein